MRPLAQLLSADDGVGGAQLVKPLTATMNGRRLRLQLQGSDQVFLVDPLPAKQGRALTRAFIEIARSVNRRCAIDALFAEALGGRNYALITGDHVQEFDEIGRYVRTWMPGACMVEPTGDVSDVVPGQRVRIIATPWDGLTLRVEEVDRLGLAALYWQSTAGRSALDAFIRLGGTGEAAAAVLPALFTSLNGHGQ